MDHARGGGQLKRLIVVRAIQNSRGAPGHQAELGFGNAKTVHPGIHGEQAVALRTVPFKGEIIVDAEGFVGVQTQAMGERARNAGCTVR